MNTPDAARATAACASRRRTLSIRHWLPDQPGAVVMALFPALAGVLLAAVMAGTRPQGTRFHTDGIWLLACWALCYGVQFTASRWLRSHGARRYLLPTLVWCAALVAVGLPFVVTHPAILGWAPVYLVLAAAVFVAAWLRRERSLWGNTVAVAASSLMALLTFAWSIEPPETVNPLASLTVPGLLLTVWFAVEQFGSVLFVKTMIRERGHTGYLVFSCAWHAALFAAACHAAFADTSGARMWPVVAVAAVLLVRAVALPLVARRRRLKPLVPGVTECVTSLLTLAAPLLTI